MSILWKDKNSNNRRKPEHIIIRDCYGRRFKRILKNLTVSNKGTCLELASGEGFWTQFLAKSFSTLATDTSTYMLEKNNHTNKEILHLPKISKESESFDLVFEANILHHIEDHQKVIDEMIRVSRRYIILIEPNRNNPLNIILGLILKHERKSLKFNYNFINKCLDPQKVRLINYESCGLLPPNKTPKLIWKLFRFLDNKIPLFGLDHCFVLEKVSGKHHLQSLGC